MTDVTFTIDELTSVISLLERLNASIKDMQLDLTIEFLKYKRG